MSTLFCFGLGYCAEHTLAAHGSRFERVLGTVRSRERAAFIATRGLAGRGVEALVFDGVTATDAIAAALSDADALLVSIAPDESGDPVIACFAEAIACAPRLSSIVYLSTVGVYGDHAGAWVDEATAANPVSARSRDRLAAEQAWAALGARAGKPVAILRLAGIYGPGHNALCQLAKGSAQRIVKPGQVFNRIHVADIAQAIDAAFARGADGVFNVSDDEPAPAQDVVAFAAALAGLSPPPEIPFAQAAQGMPAMALSFYGEVKRVRNAKMKAALGVALRYPTYREGLAALHAVGEGTACQ
jgi:nucleoside-diphosphate-sugar epimerase